MNEATSNTLNWNILKSFSKDGKDCFHFADVIERFPTTEKQYLSNVLSSMIQKGMLIKLRKDISVKDYHSYFKNKMNESKVIYNKK